MPFWQNSMQHSTSSRTSPGWAATCLLAMACAGVATAEKDVTVDVDGTKVGMLVAADQEGGEVQQLTGTGFTPMPSGLEQAQDADLRASAQAWAASCSTLSLRNRWPET